MNDTQISAEEVIEERASVELWNLLRLAFPIIISFTIRSLFTLVDTIYASFLSDAAIAAIGLAIPFEFVMIALWVGTSSGLTSYLSKGIMSKNPKGDYDIYIQSAWYIVFCMVPFFAILGIGIYFGAPLLDIDEEVRSLFQIYGTVLIVGSAFASFWSIIPDSIVKAHHDTKSTMIAGMLSNFTNIILNTVFLFVFHWGIFGIAFSTVLSRFSSLAYAIWRARALEAERIAELGPIDTPIEECEVPPISVALKRMLSLAIPSGLAYCLMSLEGLYINFLLTGMSDSTPALAAYGVYYRVSMFSLMPMIATTVAILPFVARNVQLGKFKGIISSYHGIMGVGVLYSLLAITPILLIWSDDILSFLTETETMMVYGRFALILIIPISIVSIPMIFTKPVLEGFQKGKPVMVLSVLRHVIFAIPLCYLGREFAPTYGYTGFQGVMFGLLLSTLAASLVALYVTESLFRNCKDN